MQTVMSKTNFPHSAQAMNCRFVIAMSTRRPLMLPLEFSHQLRLYLSGPHRPHALPSLVPASAHVGHSRADWAFGLQHQHDGRLGNVRYNCVRSTGRYQLYIRISYADRFFGPCQVKPQKPVPEIARPQRDVR